MLASAFRIRCHFPFAPKGTMCDSSSLLVSNGGWHFFFSHGGEACVSLNSIKLSDLGKILIPEGHPNKRRGGRSISRPRANTSGYFTGFNRHYSIVVTQSAICIVSLLLLPSAGKNAPRTGWLRLRYKGQYTRKVSFTFGKPAAHTPVSKIKRIPSPLNS